MPFEVSGKVTLVGEAGKLRGMYSTLHSKDSGERLLDV